VDGLRTRATPGSNVGVVYRRDCKYIPPARKTLPIPLPRQFVTPPLLTHVSTSPNANSNGQAALRPVPLIAHGG
jgi:hypothetical protein